MPTATQPFATAALSDEILAKATRVGAQHVRLSDGLTVCVECLEPVDLSAVVDVADDGMVCHYCGR
jgi:hypothetical protein